MRTSATLRNRWAQAQAGHQNENTVIVSMDEDFVDQWLLSAEPVRLVWIRKGNWFEPGIGRVAQTALV